MNWIKEQFGEIPQGVDYEQNILQILNDIQSENGVYFQSRQDINREIRNKKAFVENIAKDIPSDYQAEKWENYYRELEEAQKGAEYLKGSKGVEKYIRVFKSRVEKFNNKNKISC